MKIIPAILEESYNVIEDCVDAVPEARSMHIDVCDGVYVPHKTWPYTTKGQDITRDFHIDQLLSEDIGLPRWDDVEYQFDLMIQDAHEYVEIYARLGASLLIFHPTAFGNHSGLEKAIGDTNGLLTDVGIASTYDEWVAQRTYIEELLGSGTVKVFQCMSIERIGEQGSVFDDRWLSHISELKEKYPNITIQMDGGIHLENIEDVAEVGVDAVIVGSAIYGSGNASDNLLDLKNVIGQ